MHLAESYTVSHHYIGGGMGSREEILYLLTGVDVPLGNTALPQLLHYLRVYSLALSNLLHSLEGKQRVDTGVDKVHHYIVTGTDCIGHSTGTGSDKILRIAQPNIGAVGEARYTHQI